MYARIEEHHGACPTRWMCRAAGVSHRGFYSWRRRPESARRRWIGAWSSRSKRASSGSGRTYGSPRVLKDLQETATDARKRVARITKENSIVAAASSLEADHRFETRLSGEREPAGPELQQDDPNQSGWPISPTSPLRKVGCITSAAVCGSLLAEDRRLEHRADPHRSFLDPYCSGKRL